MVALIGIDDVAYVIDKLFEETNAQIVSIQFVVQEQARLNSQEAAFQTARIAYANALKEALQRRARSSCNRHKIT